MTAIRLSLAALLVALASPAAAQPPPPPPPPPPAPAAPVEEEEPPKEPEEPAEPAEPEATDPAPAEPAEPTDPAPAAEPEAGDPDPATPATPADPVPAEPAEPVAAEPADPAAPTPMGPTTPPAEPAPTEASPEPEPEPIIGGAISGGDDVDDDASPTFIKGNLIHPGTRRLLSRYDHVGVAAGVATIDADFFITITPVTAFYLDKVAFALGVPLNLLAVEGGSFDVGSFKLRREDWDEVPDYAKIIRFITVGRKEDNLYVTVNSLRPVTLGHGMLLNNYQGNIDVDRHMTGAIFDAYNDYAGFEFQANDITMVNKVVGALAFIKPLSFFSDNTLAKSLSIGGEYVADFGAPRCIRKQVDHLTCVQGDGSLLGRDAETNLPLDENTYLRTDVDTGRPDVTTATIHAAGVSTEFKFYKDDRNIDLKAYGTFHQFLNDGGGNGASIGVLGRFNAGDDYINAFRVRAEYRTFGDGFLPSYFDSLYEINKYYYPTQSNPYQVTPTKYQAIFGDSANGFVRPDHGQRHGFNLEASWGLFKHKRSGKQVAIGFGLQDSTGPDDTQFYAHLEFPMLGVLQIFGTFMKVSEADIGSLFGSEMFTANNAIVLSGLRLQILPFMFINAHYSRNFRVVKSPGSEYHLGNDTIPLAEPPAGTYPRLQETPLFENVQTLMAEIEIGWEFDDE